MIKTYDQATIEKITASGQILKQVKDQLIKMVKVGAKEQDLELFACTKIAELGGKPAFKGYLTSGKPFPTALCISINDQVVHQPAENRVFQQGDMVSIDMGVEKDGYFTDACFSIYLGNQPKGKQLLKTTKLALGKAIKTCQAGQTTDQISRVIQETIEKAGFSVVKDLTGHGIGDSLHQEPTIYNYQNPSQKVVLRPGMVIAIEPISSLGNGQISQISTKNNPWTIVSRDGKSTCHFEDTVLITKTGSKVLTS